MTEREESHYIGKEPCPKCGSRDNLARYSDGHGHCFGCGHYEHGDGSPSTTKRTRVETPERAKLRPDQEFLTEIEYGPLNKRGLTQATAEKWKYGIAYDEHHGTKVQVANYCNADGTLVGQKVRTADKKFTWKGYPKEAVLFGQWLWRDGGKMLVVTEGEIDALSVSQVQDHKWPVVSLINGAQSAKKGLAEQLPWLLKFETIVLLFDDDEVGRKAAIEAAGIFPPGRCKIGRIQGFKDANEALQAGKGGAIIDAIWGAKEYRPDGVVTLKEIAKSAAKAPPRGRPWFLPELDEATLGLRFGELVLVGAGSGVGKTHAVLHQAEHDLANGYPVALHLMEATPEQSVQTLAGLRAGRNYTEVTEGIDEAQLAKDIEAFFTGPEVFILDSQGANDWESIRDRIRHLTHANGVRIHYVDNLTTLAAGSELDEKEAVEQIVNEAAGLCVELNINIIMVSHLATPEGKPHEEGGRVMMRHFRGSRAVGYWSWIIIGMERNSQAEDEETRFSTCWRILKCRPKGSSTGKTTWVRYNPETAKLTPCPPPSPPDKSAKSHGFRDESSEPSDF